MKFIHTADLHLDSKIEGIPTEKSKIRREELLRTFERLVDFATKNQVRAIIIAGDMFDGAKITIKAKERVFQCIKNHPEIDFLYVSGNHDKTNVFCDENFTFNNFIAFNDEWKSIRYDNVCITGVALNGINQATVYDLLKLDANCLNIVVMHGQIVGYKSQEKAESISIPSLKDKNIDYLALGHIHSYANGVIDNRGKYAYSGCLDGRGFDELGEKGFVLIDTDNAINASFVPFSSRVLHEFTFNVEDYLSNYQLSEQIEKETQSKAKSADLIKVVLKGERKLEFFLDVFSIEKRLNEQFFFAKVVDKSQLKISVEDYEFDKSVRGEFVRAVWESGLSIEEKNNIITCGLSALKGEEI